MRERKRGRKASAIDGRDILIRIFDERYTQSNTCEFVVPKKKNKKLLGLVKADRSIRQ